ncbi:rhodanese-like domain-containing protein [Verrucomicrobiales bacterium]|nr:rhodanese-like domain-containing protein [Verrucomicrobiales bacterium]
MKTPFLATLFSVLLATAALAGDVTIAEAKKLVSAGDVVIVDVRTPEEFAAGHIKGAKSINVLSKDFEEKVAKLDPKKPVLVHCKMGGRSAKALATFKKLKFEKVYHMKEGYDAWTAVE